MEWWQWLVIVVFVIVFLIACLWGIQMRRRQGGVIAQRLRRKL